MSGRNRLHLARYWADNAVMSLESAQEAEVLVRELAAEWDSGDAYFVAAFHRETDEFVALVYVGLVNKHPCEFEIGFFVDRDHEGQGYVTESVRAVLCFIFEHLDAHRVRLECDDTNERSWRVAERCGMIKEGHIRENRATANGELRGTFYCGLLKREFDALCSPARS